ncbi:MAG: hypothetical protein AB8I08_13000 [Sandaracinaceae bacterium]
MRRFRLHRPPFVHPTALAVLLLGFASCRPTQLAGSAVGQYEVIGALTENTCAEGYPAPADLYFHVELRDDASGTGHWKLPNAGISSGQLDLSAGTFRFEDRQEVVGIAPSPTARGCTLARVEVVSGTLSATPNDAGTPDAGANDAGRDASTGDGGAGDAGADEPRLPGEDRFVGTTVVTVSPTPGSECGALLDPSQGGFPVLPCSITYAMTGRRVPDIW